MEKKLLEGIKVADFGQVVAGPLSTKYLSDCGAEVIKIEGKTRMDLMRRNPRSAFTQWGTNKLSVTLNLARPKAVEIAKRLIAWSDVVWDNFAAGVMTRMGLGYEELKKVKPDIIMISSCMQGHTGPAAESRGFGSILSALSGFTQLVGWPDREPRDIGVYTDFIVPHYHAFIIVAALDYRRRTGRGMYIDQSQHEASLHFIAPLLLDYAVNRREANRMGNRFAYAAPHAAYRCRGEDRWCVIAVFTDEEWESFIKVIGNPAWTKDPKFGTLLARKKHENELDGLVEEWTINYTPEEVMNMMQAAGVPAGVVETGEDLIEHDPQLKHLNFFQELDHPELGKYRAQRLPFVASKSDYEMRRPPLLGEHNTYVLREILGMSDDEIAELKADGAVE